MFDIFVMISFSHLSGFLISGHIFQQIHNHMEVCHYTV